MGYRVTFILKDTGELVTINNVHSITVKPFSIQYVKDTVSGLVKETIIDEIDYESIVISED